MQTTRLFEIIYVLLNKEIMTAKALAERFGVSTRTIYRDVDVLSLAGIPIYTEKGKKGGISLLPDFVLNKSLLSDGEQEEILTALQGLSLIGDGEAGQVLKRLSGIFNKTVTNWLEVDFTGWGFNNGDIFDGFKTAILEKRVVVFDYYSSFGDMTRRRIEPMQLWFKSRAWYVKGFCLTRQDFRLFKLVRINNLSVMDVTFGQRDFLAATPTPIPESRIKPDVTLRLRIAPEMTFRVYDEFDACSAEKQPDGSFIATITWPEDNWVYGFLLSFGEYIEVLEPAHIKDILKEKARMIYEKY